MRYPPLPLARRLSGGTWLPSLPSLAGSIGEAVPAQRPGVIFKGLLPTLCHLVFHFGQRVHFLSIPSTPPLPFCKQVKDMEPVQLLPVISFSRLPSRPHGESGRLGSLSHHSKDPHGSLQPPPTSSSSVAPAQPSP